MPPKRERSLTAECGDASGVKPAKKAAPAKGSRGRKPAAKRTVKAKLPSAGGGGRRTGVWSGEELMRLYNAMCPKRTSVNWLEVAEAVGQRNAKSCQNKWARILSKIHDAIASLGE